MQDEIVLVTLRKEDFCRDFELPAKIPLGELCPRLLVVLQKMNARVFGEWTKLVLETDEGVLQDKNATLHDYGICTGCYLSVEQED